MRLPIACAAANRHPQLLFQPLLQFAGSTAITIQDLLLTATGPRSNRIHDHASFDGHWGVHHSERWAASGIGRCVADADARHSRHADASVAPPAAQPISSLFFLSMLVFCLPCLPPLLAMCAPIHSPPHSAAQSLDLLVNGFRIEPAMYHGVGSGSAGMFSVFTNGWMHDGNLELHRWVAAGWCRGGGCSRSLPTQPARPP